MHKRIAYILAAGALMIGCPWLVVTYAGSAGMVVCLFLFFGANPLFCGLCGFCAGKDIRRLWYIPLVTALLFLAGAWLFFEMGEPAFVLYGLVYLVIGTLAMLMSGFLKSRGK